MDLLTSLRLVGLLMVCMEQAKGELASQQTSIVARMSRTAGVCLPPEPSVCQWGAWSNCQREACRHQQKEENCPNGVKPRFRHKDCGELYCIASKAHTRIRVKLNRLKEVCGLRDSVDPWNISGTLTIPDFRKRGFSWKLWFLTECVIDLNKCGCAIKEECYCSAKTSNSFSFVVNRKATVQLSEQNIVMSYQWKNSDTFHIAESPFPLVYEDIEATYSINGKRKWELKEMQSEIIYSEVSLTICLRNLLSPTITLIINGYKKTKTPGCFTEKCSPPTTVTLVYRETQGCQRNGRYTIKLLGDAILSKAGGGAADVTLTCEKVTTPLIFKKGGHVVVSARGMEISGAVLTLKQANARNHLGSYTCEGTGSVTSAPVEITQSKLTGSTWDGKTTLTCVKNSTEQGREFSYKLDGQTISGTEDTLRVTKEGIYTCKSIGDDFDSDEVEYKKESTCNLVLSVVLTCVLILGFLIPAVYFCCNMRKKNRQLSFAAANAKTPILHLDGPKPAEVKPQSYYLPPGSFAFSDQSSASGHSSWFWPYTAKSATTGVTTQSTTTV